MRRTDAAALLSFVILSIVMTWPLVPNLGRAVSDPGDPYINIWILDWVGHSLAHHPLGLFHANAFHPAKYSLAFSENLILPAVALMPLRMVGVTPIAAHNIALLAGFATSGFAAYLLVRVLTGSALAGFASGVFYAFLPFRFTHLPQVQHSFAGWLPLLLLLLLLYVRTPDRRHAAWFGLALVGTALTNVHWFFFGAFACAVVYGVVLLAGDRNWKPIATATAIAAAVIAPFFYPYFAVAKLYGMERQWSEVARHSALLGDWLVSGFHTRMYLAMTNAATDPERWLFPGFLGIALALCGVVAARRQKFLLFVALLWIALGIYGSLGTNGAFHSFLFESVPGFRAIRAPARWSAIAYVGMAVLIGFAVAALRGKLRFVAAILPFAFLYELHAVPIRWYLERPEVPEVYRWLAEQRDRGAVLELPIATLGSEYRYLLRATAHHRPIVNGVSGFAPPEYVEFAAMANTTPIDLALLDRLEDAGVTRVIVHTDTLGPRHADTVDFIERATREGRLRFEARFDEGLAGDAVYRIDRNAPRVADTDALGLKPSKQTFGLIDSPQPGAVFWGEARFSGFALSPHGIQSVTLVFNNGSVRIPATLSPDAGLARQFPWYPSTPKPRFTVTLPRKPPEIWPDTDVFAEVVDGRGVVTRLESRWFSLR